MLEFIFNKVARFQTCNVIRKKLQHRSFPVNIARHLFWKLSTNGRFRRLQKFLHSYRKPNWNKIWINIKIYCLLWTDFTTSPIVFIVDFEQLSAGWEAKGGEIKQMRSTKKYVDIFIETIFAFLASFAYWKLQTGKQLFRKKQ